MTIPTRRIEDIQEGTLPGHCRILCGQCFDAVTPMFNETSKRFEFLSNRVEAPPTAWDVTSNPMAWGAKNPRHLLLGVSKGPNQIRHVGDLSKHNVVPFDGLRDTITEALRLMGLFRPDEHFGQKIRPTETDWAFGSVVRCTLGTVDENGSVQRTKNVVGPLTEMSDEDSWISKCVSVFYRKLPPRLETVVLLSNDDDYVTACFKAFSNIDNTIKRLDGNKVAYGNGKVTFVHIVHPAALRGRIDEPKHGNHVGNWFAGGTDSQGRKRQDALRALGRLKTGP